MGDGWKESAEQTEVSSLFVGQKHGTKLSGHTNRSEFRTRPPTAVGPLHPCRSTPAQALESQPEAGPCVSLRTCRQPFSPGCTSSSPSPEAWPAAQGGWDPHPGRQSGQYLGKEKKQLLLQVSEFPWRTACSRGRSTTALHTLVTASQGPPRPGDMEVQAATV